MSNPKHRVDYSNAERQVIEAVLRVVRGEANHATVRRTERGAIFIDTPQTGTMQTRRIA